MSFRNIKAGDRVRFVIRHSYGMTTHTAKVNPLLIFHGHVVVNHGVNGTVVDGGNFCRIMPRRKAKT